eukprot:GDKI01025455.1.p1 GENE.GDKI01025455.1~~GDKI01025455.1.p1  ORF type:complete len:362 (+),score=121.69 GDKI01025455.1:210-1295(+)
MRFPATLFTLLALSLSAASTDAAQQDAVQAKNERLVQWVRNFGGIVRGEVRVDPATGMRGLFATERIGKGETILSVPSSLILNLSGGESSFLESTLRMLRELKLKDKSRFWPYIDSLPGPNEVLHSCNIDPHYLPMYKNDQLESSPRMLQDHLATLLSNDMSQLLHEPLLLHEAVGNETVTLDDLKYACALTNTRSVGGRNRVLMVPVYDMANHRHDCTNHIEVYTQSVGANLVILAGSDLKPGDEICNHYGIHHDDYAVAHYGFLPPTHTPPKLAQVDERQPPLPDSATHLELQAELARLQAVLTDINSRPDTVTPRTHTPGGVDYVYATMKQLEQRRRDAIQHEMNRIRKLVGGAGEEL